MPDAKDGKRDHRSALAELSLVRMREFVREPEAVFWTFVFPLLLAAGLGIAFRNRPPETVRVAVVTSTPAGQGAADALGRSKGLIVERLAAESTATRMLSTGAVALVVAPAGVRGHAPHDSVGVEYRFDPSRPDARSARALADEVLQRAAGRRDPLAVREMTVQARGSRYIDFLIPGLLGLNIMGSSVWSIAFSIVTARNKKLLKRLVATPMPRSHYLFSFIVSRLVFLVSEVAVLVAFGVWVFGVPVRGSFATLAIVALVAALSFSAVGLLVSSRAKTIEAASGITNLVMMPMWIFSGVFFSSSNFPAAFQPVIRVLPLTATVDALRAAMLQGASLAGVGSQLAILAGWLVVTFSIALRVFRWR